MAHPIIVDTIENSFVPLLTHNNSIGDTAQLKRFDEPSWNYQVVRFLDSDAKDIIPRKDKVWDIKSLTKRMILTLEKSDQETPPLLEFLEQETDTTNHAQAAFSMYCFWTGELKLGAIEGVITTEAGHYDGHEVTLVTYDKSQLSLKGLLTQATAINCFDRAYVPPSLVKSAKSYIPAPIGELTKGYQKAKSSDQKRQIRGTPFAKLNLSPAQATKVNSFARSNPQKAKGYLTKRQLSDL